MEQKTKVHAEAGKQDLLITREFDLPVGLLFKAHTDPELLAQWMGTKVLKFENRKHGGWEIETSDPKGKVAFKAHGVFHEIIKNKKIIRTFEMENASFDAQIEFIEFESIGEEKSRLTIRSIYRSAELRDQQLKLPFAFGINMAHRRLEELLMNYK
jgi:uncharacterized protein YndB with AHSA1/START domain